MIGISILFACKYFKSLAVDLVVNLLPFPREITKKSKRTFLILDPYLSRIMKLLTNGFVLQLKPTRM